MSGMSSRRSMLLGAAGLSVSLAACERETAARQAEEQGAFPDLPGMGDLIGPKAGEARLHSNENPYGPAKSALKMIEYAAKKGAYYADGAVNTLRDMIAERHGVTRDHVTISTGSAEALSAIAVVYGQKGPIVAPRLFFDATPLYAKRLGLAHIARAPMDDNIGVDLAAIEAMVTPQTGCVQLCNPNNPTGLLSPAGPLKAAVKRMAAKTTVVVDEAYMELTDDPQGNSCIDLVKAGHDVIVARTFSKIYGMAGIRVGYLIADPQTTQTLRSAKMSWLSGVSIAAAIGCYNDTAFLEFSKAKVREARDMVGDTLSGLGLEAKPSQTNFIFFKSGKPANELRDALAAQSINIRGQYMDYTDWSRVSMGRLEDVERFCTALPQALNA